MPILLVDAEGTPIFYNEPTEALLNQRFQETGEIPADEWNTLVTVADEDRNLVLPEDRPMTAALLQRRPISRTQRDSEWRQLQVTSSPLIGERGHLRGVMNILWEI